MDHFTRIIEKRVDGIPAGIYSACSANEYVLKAALEAGRENNTPVLIEATANQCNQFGGYTGMNPAGFVAFVKRMAKESGLAPDMLILGGDHLGPLTWQNESESSAMRKSDELIAQYVLAGFTKIHLDTSMRLAGDDRNVRLSDEIIANRAARLAKAAELAYARLKAGDPMAPPPLYVIGSEVPIPGGVREHKDSPECGVEVTTPEQFSETYETFKSVFHAGGLEDAFSRVIGVVIEAGIEFSDDGIVEYDRNKAYALTNRLKQYEGIVFEGHSTDYQTRQKLKQMVEDGIAMLKVGPALTFYFREAVFALADIEKELSPGFPSDLKAVLDNEMINNPGNWTNYYSGSDKELSFKRKYSLSDRCRYYFPAKNVSNALGRLISNINASRVPLSLLSQFMPTAIARLRESDSKITAENLIKARIKDCIEDYLYATNIYL